MLILAESGRMKGDIAVIRLVEDLLLPDVEKTVAALEPGPEDAAVVQVALTTAKNIDQMSEKYRATMLPQHVGILLRALETLEKHARERRKAGGGGGAQVSRLDELRQAQARRGKPPV